MMAPSGTLSGYDYIRIGRGENYLMIMSKEEYKLYLKADQIALSKTRFKRPPLLREHLWRYQRLLRKCEYYKNCRKDPVGRLYYWFLYYRFIRRSMFFGFTIAPNTIGKGLAIEHYPGIILSHDAKYGDFFRVHAGVTVGNYRGKQAPIIGNCVYVGPGAKIFGGITIGDNVAIGANAVVNKDVPPNVSVAGVPAKIISNKGSTDPENPLIRYDASLL